MRIPSFNKIVGLVLFLSVVATEFLIVYSGKIYNLSIFGSHSFLSVILGFLLGFSLTYGRKVSFTWIIIAFVVQITLFSVSIFSGLIRDSCIGIFGAHTLIE